MNNLLQRIIFKFKIYTHLLLLNDSLTGSLFISTIHTFCIFLRASAVY